MMQLSIILLRYTPHREPPPMEINWTTAGIGLLIGVVAFIWMALSQDSKNEYAGCLPGVLIIVAGVLLFPLITWICVAVNVFVGIAFILVPIFSFLMLKGKTKK